MAIIENTINLADPLSEEQIQELRAASGSQIAFDEDCPELTPEQYQEMAQIARRRRQDAKKPVISLRISPDTLRKAQATGRGYTGFLSRLLDVAINDPEIVKRCL